MILPLTGCLEEEPGKTFVETFDDGFQVTANIEYRVEGCADDFRLVDCYYYMVTLESPIPFAQTAGISGSTAEDLTLARQALAEGAKPVRVEEIFKERTGCSLRELEEVCRSVSHVRLRFYDSQGFSLYQHRAGWSRGNALEPGYNDVPEEMEFSEDMRRWTGRFPAPSLPLREFRSDVEMEAELVVTPGCPE